MAETRSAEDAVTEALRDAIRSGVLVPGERLAQAELAEQLGVSRIPLRDALRRLEVEGTVRIDGRRGAYVTALTPDDVWEIYEIRILLEDRCVRGAVRALTEADAKRLVKLSEEMDRYEDSPLEGYRARRAFYEKLYEFAGKPRMARTIIQLRDNVDRYHILSDRQHAHEAHEAFRIALRERDASAAAGILRAHLEETRDDLLRSMNGEPSAARK